jgi:hypothetical protein
VIYLGEKRLNFDLALSLAFAAVTAICLLVYLKLEKRLDRKLGDTRLSWVGALVAALIMGVMISLISLFATAGTPSASRGESFTVFFFLIFLGMTGWFSSVVFDRFFLIPAFASLGLGGYAVLFGSPLQNFWISNLLAVAYGLMITVYIAHCFDLKGSLVFAAGLTAMDVVQVFLTGHMVTSARFAMSLNLPILIRIPVFPPCTVNGQPWIVGLGLGDIMLAGLLVIQLGRKYGKRAGLASVASQTVGFLLFELLFLNSDLKFFPATVVVTCGWIPIAVFCFIRGKGF